MSERDKAAVRWVELVAHYHRGEITIDIEGSDGGAAEVIVQEDGRVYSTTTGLEIDLDGEWTKR